MVARQPNTAGTPRKLLSVHHFRHTNFASEAEVRALPGQRQRT